MKKTELYKICALSNGHLFVMPKPDGEQLNIDLEYYKSQGVTKVLSLLLPEEIEKLGLQNEASSCAETGLIFLNFSIKDMSVPDEKALKELHTELKADLANGQSIAVHCHGGRGRAGTVAITLMIEHGYDAQQAIQIASAARGDNMPVNDLQTEFVLNYRL